MAMSYGNVSAWKGFMHNRTANTSTSRVARPTNNEELTGIVMSINDARRTGAAGGTGGLQSAPLSSASASGSSGAGAGSMKPQKRVVMRLGALAQDPEVSAQHTLAAAGTLAVAAPVAQPVRSRSFKIERSKNIKPEVEHLVPPEKERVLTPYVYVDFNVAVDEVDRIGGIEPGDIIVAHGIRFNYWYSNKTGKVLLFCNVDKVMAVPGARREQFAYNLVQAARFPVHFLKPDTGNDGNGEGEEGSNTAAFQRRLGREWYKLDVFNSAHADEQAYTKRGEGEIYELDFTERSSEKDAKIAIVTWRPDVFNTKAGSGFIVQNGLKTIARGVQWREAASFEAARDVGHAYVTQIWLRLSGEHVAPWCIEGESDWKTAGKALMSTAKYSVIVRENMESTKRELTASQIEDGGAAADFAAANENPEDGDVDMKMVASAQVFLCNTASEIRRLGLLVPPEKLFEAMALPAPAQPGGDIELRSPQHATNYHRFAARRSVINLNEYAGKLNDLLKTNNYDFFVVHTLETDDDRMALEALPADKRYLLFDRTFRTAWSAAVKQPDKKTVLTRYNIDTELALSVSELVGRTAGAASRIFYAVIKEDVMRRNYFESDLFQRAVRCFVADPDAFLAELTGQPAPAAAAASVPPKTDAMEGVTDNTEKAGTKRAADAEAQGAPDKKKAKVEEKKPKKKETDKKKQKGKGKGKGKGKKERSVSSSSDDNDEDDGSDSSSSGSSEYSDSDNDELLGDADTEALVAAGAAKDKKGKGKKGK